MIFVRNMKKLLKYGDREDRKLENELSVRGGGMRGGNVS